MRFLAPTSSRTWPIRLMVVALVFASCQSRTPSEAPAAPDAGASDVPVTRAAEPTAPPPPASPSPLPLGQAQALVLDATVPLSSEQVTTVDPAARFLVEVRACLEDARLVLVDEQDSMVPVEGTTELGATTRFTLVPSNTLTPGASYILRVEGATRREVSDSEGRTYPPSLLRLRTSGERPHPAAVKRSRPTKKRR